MRYVRSIFSSRACGARQPLPSFVYSIISSRLDEAACSTVLDLSAGGNKHPPRLWSRIQLGGVFIWETPLIQTYTWESLRSKLVANLWTNNNYYLSLIHISEPTRPY